MASGLAMVLLCASAVRADRPCDRAQAPPCELRHAGGGWHASVTQRRLRLDAASDAFERNGYASLPNTSTAVGLGADVFVHRVRLGIDASYSVAKPESSTRDGQIDASVWHVLAEASVGYHVLEVEGFSAYPFFGIGVGRLGVDVNTALPPILSQELDGLAGRDSVRRTLLLGSLGLGLSTLIPLDSRDDLATDLLSTREGIELSLHGGYGSQLAATDWGGPRDDLGSDPDASMSGPFLQVFIGYGSRQWHGGSCRNHCPSRDNALTLCRRDACSFECSEGYGDCDHLVANGCETPLTLLTDCGACGTPCSVEHGEATCDPGWCEVARCESGWANCDGFPLNGCETNVVLDAGHCGRCGHACSKEETCLRGRCVTEHEGTERGIR